MARRSLKYNAAVLTVTGFLVKAIGFVYRVFIANSIGAEGMGLYQLVTPIYSLLVLVLSAGISIAVSRFVAEESAKNGEGKGMRIVTLSAGLVLIAGVIVCGVLLLNLDTLVLGLAGDVRARKSLIWMLIFVPAIAAGSAYKGYFYGREDMMPNSIGQILEQIAKLIFVLLLFKAFKGGGIESMCLLAVIAMLVGECVNVLTVLVAFWMAKAKKPHANSARRERGTLRKIAKAALPISINRFILSILGAIENVLIPQCLVLYGLTFQESLKVLGRLSGMAAPLVFFPSMLPGALATALVPAIASAVAAKRYAIANRQISQSIKLTLTMGLIFTSFFACCSQEIAELIYPGENVGGVLYILAFSGVFLYLQQTMLGILNGLAQETAILINTFIGTAIRLVIIRFAIPVWGVDAYIYALIAGSALSIGLNMRKISKITGMSIDVGEWLLKPLVAALLGSLMAILLKRLPQLWQMSQRISFVLSMGIALGAILLAFLVLGIVKREDLKRWAGRHHMFMYEL
jgi:stage V sporulation protein B